MKSLFHIKVQLIIFGKEEKNENRINGKCFTTALWKVRWNIFVNTIHVCNILPLPVSVAYVSATKRLYICVFFCAKRRFVCFLTGFRSDVNNIYLYHVCVYTFISHFANRKSFVLWFIAGNRFAAWVLEEEQILK